MSPPSIALVVKYYPPIERISGIIGYVRLLARELAERHEVHVVTARVDRRAPAEELYEGQMVHRVAGPFPISAGSVVNRIKPDATIVMSGIYDLRQAMPYFAAFDVTAKRSGRRMFYQMTNVRGRANRPFAWLLNSYDHVLCASDLIADRLAGTVRSPISVLTPGIDLSTLGHVQPERTNAALRVGFVNHLNRVKGADLALAAFRQVAEAREDVEFVIAGTGDLADELLAEYGHEHRFSFRGFLDDDDRMAVMASCDVMVLPFRTEVSVLGVSQTVLECMALGCVIVGSRSGSIAPAIEDGVTGLLYDDEDALATTLLDALEDGRRESLGAAARASALANADIRTRADVITDLAAARV